MKNDTIKFLLVMAIVAAAAVTLSHVIFPNPLQFIPPSSAQMPFFQFLGFVEAVSLGFGVSFLLFGWKHVKRSFQNQKVLARFSFFSAVWLLVSWWFHDNLHRVTAERDYTSLLQIEYAFHLALMIGGFGIAYFLWTVYLDRIAHLPQPEERSGPPF